jgi:hypothetical protein
MLWVLRKHGEKIIGISGGKGFIEILDAIPEVFEELDDHAHSNG